MHARRLEPVNRSEPVNESGFDKVTFSQLAGPFNTSPAGE